MTERSFTKKQREFRHAILVRDNHTCRYCGATAHQIDFLPGNEVVACCRDCLLWLKHARPAWTFEQRKHLIDTMRIANPIKPTRPRLPNRHRK